MMRRNLVLSVDRLSRSLSWPQYMVLRLSPFSRSISVDWAKVARFGCYQHPANSEIG